MSVSEIRKGDFVYRDALFVEVGEGKRHPRAAPSELRELLLPKKGATKDKDQVAHWYEAQLVHYGLTRSKDKNTAKVRLTAALSTDGLKVPGELLQKEADMKKDYLAAVRKAKTAEKKAATSSATTNGKKRKADDTSSTTITLEVDGVKLTVDRSTGAVKEGVTKRKKTEPTTLAPSKPKVTERKAPTSPAVPKPPPVVAPASPARAKQTARRSRPGPTYPSASSRPAPPKRSVVNHTPQSFQAFSDQEEDAPPAYESLDFTSNHKPSKMPISGTYDIGSPGQPCDFVLRIDKAENLLWGQFEIDSMTGILLMENIDIIPNGTFRWRAEDTTSGQILFRRDQTGWVEFDKRGGIQGSFRGLLDGGDVHFDGKLQSESAPGAQDFQSEWERLPRKAYGRGRG